MSDDAKFCHNCGTKYVSENNKVSDKKIKNYKLPFYKKKPILLCCIGLIVNFLLFALLSGGNDTNNITNDTDTNNSINSSDIDYIKSHYMNYEFYGYSDEPYIRVHGTVYEIVDDYYIVKEESTGDLVAIGNTNNSLNMSKGDIVDIYSYAYVHVMPSPLDYREKMPMITYQYGEINS